MTVSSRVPRILSVSVFLGRMEEVLAWKMPGAGGGGYLALVVKDSLKFAENYDEAIHLQIRRA